MAHDPLPAHLRDDAPYAVCSGCGRKSWGGSEAGSRCGMTQPDGSSCDGSLRPEQEGATDEAGVERIVRILRALTDVVPFEVDKDFPATMGMSTCILSTRVGFEVLRHFGVPKRAIAVSVGVFNRPLVERIGSEGRFPRDEEMEKWFKQDGSWGLGIGRTGSVEAGRFDGHMALLVFPNQDDESGGVLIDLALQQNSRPKKKITLEPMVGTVPKDFLKGETFITSMNDCVVRYDRLDSDQWQLAPDWRDKERREFIVKRSIAKIELTLAAHA